MLRVAFPAGWSFVPTVMINGMGLAYDIIGTGARIAVITPGGRFSKDTPGVRTLSERLADGGLRVLIWDRPNCGESDLSFTGESESLMHADALAGLLRALDLAPALVVGGSAGSRVSLLTAIRHPDVVDRLFILWISGGAVGLAALAFHYCHESLAAASLGGMEAVAALPAWQEQLTRNPRNREIMLGQDVAAFVETMKKWAGGYFPKDNSPVPDLVPLELAKLKMPIMVLRSGASDYHHPRETSETVHTMIPGSQIAEPPWGDREWIERLQASARGEGLFARWPLLAPQILEFAGIR
jgi:pimeloyl-ACP methyl ester carboxylesterase